MLKGLHVRLHLTLICIYGYLLTGVVGKERDTETEKNHLVIVSSMKINM